MQFRTAKALTLTVLAAAFLLLPASVTAEDGPETEQPRDERRPGRKARKHREAILERFDVNGNGQLDEEERKAARKARKQRHEGRQERRLKRFDKNGDGKLNDEERKSATKARKQRHEGRRERRLKRFDKNAVVGRSPDHPTGWTGRVGRGDLRSME